VTDYLNESNVDQQIVSGYADLLGRKKYADGKGYIYAYAGVNLTAETPYVLSCRATAGESPAIKAVADDAKKNMVVVPDISVSSGDRLWIQFQGPATVTVADTTYTAGDGLKIHNGAVTDMGAAHSNADEEFASITTGGDTTTSLTVYLVGREALGTT